MPTAEQILEGLRTIAREAWLVALLWHVAAVAAIVALLAGWRPSRKIAAILLAIPVISASS